MNTIEEKLWAYIDGTCTPGERESIRKLIDTDAIYSQKYDELLALNDEFANMELDEPSMAFTYNVMETIRTENAMKPLKSAINNNIIWGIAAFFIMAIGGMLVYTLANVSWTLAASAPVINYTFKMPDIQHYFSGGVFRSFIFCDIVLALYLADNYLRKKLTKTAVN
jgi:hypothetical protein